MNNAWHARVLHRRGGQLLFLFVITIGILLPTLSYALDSDNDGLDDADEIRYYTNPVLADTDADGYSDGVEVANDYSPHKGEGTRLNEFDYDGDGLNDWAERWFSADIGKADTSGDGISDYEQVMRGQHPQGGDTTFSRQIVVDRSKQRLYYYVDGIKIHNWPVSTGNPGSETPAGMFTIDKLIDTKRYVGPGYDLPNVKWNMQFKPMYYIHAAYWHNDFGRRTHSHGCVNMTEKDAGELYRYMDMGVPVSIIGETPKNYRVEE